MSVWIPNNASEVKDTLHCPDCGHLLQFGSMLAMPELLKCDGCKAQFCMITRGRKFLRNKPEGKPHGGI